MIHAIGMLLIFLLMLPNLADLWVMGNTASQQRVAAARALVTDPAIIMADEPTGALDSKNARLLLESFETMNRSYQATVLMVTHDSFAASYTHRVLFIRDGRIFTELRRGGSSRQEFFDRIMGIVAMMGGEGSDAL